MVRACAAALLASLVAAPALAGDPAATMQRFSGDWVGTGKVLIGPQTGLEFHCELSGDKRQRTILEFKMRGRCWMGALSGSVHASLRYNRETDQFYGEFMDGADGDGVDIVANEAAPGISMRLSRGTIRGNLVAEPVNGDQMRVLMTLIEPLGTREVPVVAMGYVRKEAAAIGLPPYVPDVVTGSIGAR